MIRRLLCSSALGLSMALSPVALAQDSGGSDGSDGSDDDGSFEQGTEVGAYDEEYEVEDESGCAVVSGTAALGVTALAGLAVVARRRD